jgi:septal ring factor EnvC (AmiA/AmiB activator)
MEAEILLKRKPSVAEADAEGDPNLLKDLEEKVSDLLKAFQEIKRERDGLASALGMEREKSSRLEKKLEFFSQEREKVKIKIDQLLHRLKGAGG